MSTGEDVLCSFTQGDGFVTLKDAVVIVPTQQNSVQFVPYSPFTDPETEIHVSSDKVMFVADPQNQFVNQHKQMFGGIVAPDQKIIV